MLGDFVERQAVRDRLLALAVAALIGMLFLFQAAFGSWRLAALAVLTVPAALAGGALAALISGGVLSLGSLAGLLAVFGIAACNKIVLINRYQHLQRYEGEPFGPALVLRGAREQLPPILLATFATGVAFLPVLLLGDVPGLEILRPMTIVTLGGLVTASKVKRTDKDPGSLLDLVFLPALFLTLGVRWVQEPDLVVEAAPGRVFDGMQAIPRMAGD